MRDFKPRIGTEPIENVIGTEVYLTLIENVIGTEVYLTLIENCSEFMQFVSFNHLNIKENSFERRT